MPVKIRWLLDLAAEVNELFVNTKLLKSPVVYVSIQFIERSISVNADIKEMFLRVKLRDEDHKSLRFYKSPAKVLSQWWHMVSYTVSFQFRPNEEHPDVLFFVRQQRLNC